MTGRRITALVCALAIALLVLGALTRRWLVADVRSPTVNASLRIGLTAVSVCVVSTERADCQTQAWSEVPGCAEGGSWRWLGRLTFGLVLAAAAVLAGLGVIAAAGLEVHLPIPVPRLVLWTCGALFPLMGGYYLLTPRALGDAVVAGRGFALVAGGAILGLVAAWRETDDRMA